MTINWKDFDLRYIKLETDVEKVLKLTNWTSVNDKTGKSILQCEVLEEDGKVCNPTRLITFSSKKLISRQLRPMIVEADNKGKKELTLRICKKGDGFQTVYEISKV